MEDLKNIIESLLFVAEEPLTLDRIKDVLELDDRKPIREALRELEADYESKTGAFVLREVAGGFQFRSRAEYVPWIKKLIQPKPARLSKAALETLAIIADLDLQLAIFFPYRHPHPRGSCMASHIGQSFSDAAQQMFAIALGHIQLLWHIEGTKNARCLFKTFYFAADGFGRFCVGGAQIVDGAEGAGETDGGFYQPEDEDAIRRKEQAKARKDCFFQNKNTN